MKSPAGYAPPRRLAAQKKQVRLNLRRTAVQAADESGLEPKSHFWKWVGLVALLHVVIICGMGWFYLSSSTPPPPESYISLLPEGDVVKGTPGAQAAPKVGLSTPAPAIQHTEPPPVAAVPPPPPVPAPEQIQPKAVLKPEAPALVQEKPVKPPKPVPPKPKVKVDLNLADGPAPVAEKPLKPKPTHPKKPVETTPAANAPDRPAASRPETTGLSKEEIARKLGEKLQNAGVAQAVNRGPSGSEHSQANPFADFYLAVRDQVMSKWEHPNLTDESAVNPEVKIYVEKDGRVPPESVTLVRSSGNPAYDESALAAARSLGYLLEPLPNGCPPDISITFKLTR